MGRWNFNGWKTNTDVELMHDKTFYPIINQNIMTA